MASGALRRVRGGDGMTLCRLPLLTRRAANCLHEASSSAGPSSSASEIAAQ